MGGIGSVVNIVGVAVGEVEGRAQALKVEGDALCTMNETPHVTLFVSRNGKYPRRPTLQRKNN